MPDRLRAANIKLKRAYEPPSEDDGARILVERLWPRGVKKDEAAIDEWAKEIAPSTGLRQWFGHDPNRWDAFCQRYADELAEHAEGVAALRDRARRGPVTLVYAARDTEHNSAVALRQVLLGRSKRSVRHAA